MTLFYSRFLHQNIIYNTRTKCFVYVGNSRITSTTCVGNLGVIFESTMIMAQQVASKYRFDYTQLCSVECIRRYLSSDATESLMHALATSTLNTMINRLYRVQHTAARIVTITT